MVAAEERTRPFRLCVTGAECTGKSTLAQALAERLGAPIVHEVVRAYFEEKTALGDPNVYAGDIARLIDLQSHVEDAAPTDVPLIVLDTDLFTIDVWHERVLGHRIAELDQLVELRQESDRRIDLYILVSPDVPFVFDRIRSSEAYREEMHGVFRQRLTQSHRRFVEVSGSLDERCAQALGALALALAEEPGLFVD